MSLRRLLTALLVIALVAAACGGDDDEETGGAATTTANTSEDTSEDTTPSAEEPTGTPIKIGVQSTFESAAFSFKGSLAGAQLAAKNINEAGGVDGHPIEIVECDDKNDPNTATTCANTLINDEQVVFMTGGQGTQTNAVIAVAEEAGTPVFGSNPVSNGDQTSAVSYPFGSSTVGYSNIALTKAEDEDWQTAVVLGIDNPVADVTMQSAQDSFESAGVDEVTVIRISPTTADYGPVIARVQAEDPDVWSMALGNAATVQALQAAVTAGFEKPMVFTSGSLTQQLLDFIDQTNYDVRWTSEFGYDPSTSPMAEVYDEQVSEAEDEVPDATANYTKSAWLAVMLYAQLVNDGEITDLTAAGLREYLDSTPDIETGFTAPIDFTNPGPVDAFPRIVNVQAVTAHYEDGEIVQTSEEFESLVGE